MPGGETCSASDSSASDSLRGAEEKGPVVTEQNRVQKSTFPAAQEQEAGAAEPEKTTHNFWARLAGKGLKPEFGYTGELFSDISGGLRRASVYLDNFSLSLTLDLGKLARWKGAQLHFHGLSIQGRNPSDDVGDFQTVSNIAAVPATRLYEAWFEQRLFGGRLSFLAGIYDLNSEFEVIESASVFVNSSQAIEPSFAKSGRNGPSIFPFTTLGFRVKYQPDSRLYVQSVVLNGVAGDPNNPRGTHILLREGNGVLSATEVGHLYWATGHKVRETPGASRTFRRYAQPVYDGKMALGFWFYTAKFPSVLAGPPGSNPPPERRGDAGVYFLLARTVYRVSGQTARHLSVFARLGLANPKINRIGFSTIGGVAFTGIFRGRKDDVLGLGVSAAHNGNDYLKAEALAGRRAVRSEWSVELAYQAQITSWAAIHPDVQYIIHPGTAAGVRNALAVDLRLEISL